MKKTIKNKLLMTLCACSALAVVGGGMGLSKQVHADDVVQGQTDAVSLIYGAACRVDSAESSGLRFMASVDKAEWGDLVSTYQEDNVFAGMMIVPKEIVATIDEYTITALSEEVDFSQIQCFADTNGFRTATINGEETYVYSKTLVTKESNYTRDFVARAYIKIVGEEGIEDLNNADYYEGAYYLYSDYSLSANMRSVYDVAKAAYNDRLTEAERDTDEEKVEYDQLINDAYSPYNQTYLDNMKVFLDGVADIKKEEGKAVIANNTEYYTSPYSLTQVNNGVALIDVSTKAPVSMQYNGEREEDFTVNDNGVSVALYKKYSVGTLDSNGLIFPKQNGASGNNANGAQWSQYWYYLSFMGDYGVGTYVDFSFKGEDMPQLIFFADDETPETVKSNGKGVFLTNGYHSDRTQFTMMQAFGPNCLSGGTYGNDTKALMTLKSDVYPELTGVGLANNPTKSYDYTVGTFIGTDNNVGMHIILKDASTNEIIYEVRRSLGLTEEQVGSGNIIAIAPFGGKTAADGGEVAISNFSVPYAYTPSDNSYTKDPFEAKGATFNDDGTVTLTSCGFACDKLSDQEFGYIAFNGNYGVGYTMEFIFQGLNMPDVVLFADQINGAKMGNKGNGMLLTGGMGGWASNGPSQDVSIDGEIADFRVYGMRKALTGSGFDWAAAGGFDGYTGGLNATLYGKTGGSTYADYPLLTQAGLDGTTDTYKYVVSTKLNADNKIVVVVSLYKQVGTEFVEIQNANGDTYTNLEIVTTFTEADIKGTNIVVQAAAHVDKNSANFPTTFSYVAPYKVESVNELF